MTKQELERMSDLGTQLERLRQKQDELFDQRTRITAVYSDMPKGGQYVDQMAEYVARLEEMELEYKEVFDEHTNLLIRYTKAVATLRGRERRVLELRYMKHMNWRKIAWKMNYSEPRLIHIHAEALHKIEQF